jgi:FixJ family two-component response regulator
MILMTALSNENVKARAMAGGAVCFLIQQFQARTLLGCVNAALKR